MNFGDVDVPFAVILSWLTLTLTQLDFFQLNQIQNGQLLAIINLICLISDKPCQIARPLL